MNVEIIGNWYDFALGALMLAMVIIWFVLLTRLFKRLKNFHQQKFSSMGEPSLFLNNSLKTNWTTMRFLFAREHRAMGDPHLSKLSDFMLAFLTVYLGLFVSMSFYVVLFKSQAA